MRRLLYGLFLVGLILNINVPFVAAQVNITGPTETPVNVPGIPFPNPFMGDRIIYPGNEEVMIGASVGEFVVNISGLSSPNASVVLSDTGGQFLRSTVADNRGYFYISQLNVRKGFSGFCLDSVDFQRIGDSQGCLNFEPIQASRDFTDVFLPPTLGLYRREINAGEQALIYGYSMPGAKVEVESDKGDTFTITADDNGYYEYRYDDVPAGVYNLSSTADLGSLSSLPPTKQKTLTVLSIPEQITTTVEDVGEETSRLLFTTIWGFLLLLFLLLFIIGLLLLIINPVWRHAIVNAFKKGLRRPLHHDWYLDFLDEYEAKQARNRV